MFFFRRSQPRIEQRDTLAIRLEAIGGQGAHSAGKIIAEAAVLGMGYSGHHFSSFGSEKRGSPVRSYIRFYKDRRPVRSSAPVVYPDVLAIFHESLMEKNPEILLDLSARSIVLINTDKPVDQIRFPEGTCAGQVAVIDALKIANKAGCGLNSVMLGAIARLCPEITSEAIEKTLEGFFHKLSEAARKRNLEGFDRGKSHVEVNDFVTRQATEEIPERPLPKMGWLNAPIGGVIVNPGNTFLRDLSTSRQGTIPEFKPDLCIHCGYCDMVCPDYCFVWKKPSGPTAAPMLEGIDYQYCKGCQKCVEACPMGALVAVPENENFVRERRVPKFPARK